MRQSITLIGCGKAKQPEAWNGQAKDLYISPKPPVPTWMLDFHEAVLKASSKVLQLPRGRLGLREMMHMERTRFVDPEA